MELNMLTAVQGRTCAVIHTEYCVYISDNFHNVTQVLAALAVEISCVATLGADSFATW